MQEEKKATNETHQKRFTTHFLVEVNKDTLTTKRAGSLALGLAVLEELGVAVEGLLLRVAHGAGETLAAEILLANVAYYFTVLDALDGKTGANVVIVIGGRGVEPIREGQDAWLGGEGNLDGDREGVIVWVKGERGGVSGAGQKRRGENEEGGAAELHVCDCLKELRWD